MFVRLAFFFWHGPSPCALYIYLSLSYVCLSQITVNTKHV